MNSQYENALRNTVNHIIRFPETWDQHAPFYDEHTGTHCFVGLFCRFAALPFDSIRVCEIFEIHNHDFVTKFFDADLTFDEIYRNVCELLGIKRGKYPLL